MTAIVRIGDINAAGGAALIPRPTVLSSFVPLAAFMSRVSPHPCCGAPGCTIHCVATIGSARAVDVLAEGTPIHIVGDVDICGHPRVTGDFTVIYAGGGGGGAPSYTGITPNVPLNLSNSSGYGEVGRVAA